MIEHSEARNKPSTVRGNRTTLKVHVLPALGKIIRLQFEFAARMSEVLLLEWGWIDFANKRVVSPDSKTGGMSKPLSAEALRLLREAPRYARSMFVIPALFDGSQAITKNTCWAGWKHILERAEVPQCGTHALRHEGPAILAKHAPVAAEENVSARLAVEKFKNP